MEETQMIQTQVVMAEVLTVHQDMLQCFQSLHSSARHVTVLTGV